MGLQQNVGGTDRTVRGVLAVALVVVALTALKTGKRNTGILAGIGAAGMAFNYTTQFCGLNAALGLDTCAETEADQIEA